MAEHSQSELIAAHPIEAGLDAFRASFDLICKSKNTTCLPHALDYLDRKDIQDLASSLLSSLHILPITRLLRSNSNPGTLRSDLLRLVSAATSADFDFDSVRPLLQLVLADSSDDSLIWDQVYKTVNQSFTPPPRPIASSLQQTPWLRNRSSFANSSEHRKHIDGVLKEELRPLHVGLRDFQTVFFGGVADLDAASETTFEKCKAGDTPLFDEGWQGWPEDANQEDVLRWFAEVSNRLAEFAEEYGPDRPNQRRLLAIPNRPIDGSVGKRKLDIGYVGDLRVTQDSKCHWSQILVPGELKSNPAADKASEAWLDLGRYAREVLAAQDTRRFVLGFTICGSVMRIWVIH